MEYYKQALDFDTRDLSTLATFEFVMANYLTLPERTKYILKETILGL